LPLAEAAMQPLSQESARQQSLSNIPWHPIPLGVLLFPWKKGLGCSEPLQTYWSSAPSFCRSGGAWGQWRCCYAIWLECHYGNMMVMILPARHTMVLRQ
jgi:hypothetical protein